MMSKRIAMSLAYILLLLSMNVISYSAQQGKLVGQSSTILPDGRTLVTGGLDTKSKVSNSASILGGDGTATPLLKGMNLARAGHTSTVLPNGTVLIFGGVGDDGKIIPVAEVFDPATQMFAVLADVAAVPRAFHTATLLTDGKVLFAGGVLAGSEFPDDVQLYDYRSKSAVSEHAVLAIPREGHSAELLSDGTVSISGGTDHFGKASAVREIFDPVTSRFRFSSGDPDLDAGLPVRIAASLPQNGANDVAIQNPIAIRFSRLVAYPSVNTNNFVLVGPRETSVDVTVAAAEKGRLAFVLPSSPLQTGTTYTLQIKNVVDLSGAQLADTSLTFQTQGAPPDESGADWIPNSTWTDNTGTTKFQQLPALQGRPGATALAGQVLKLNGWPLQDVEVEIDGKKTRTDSTGRFLLPGLTPGHHVLWIDGTPASHANAKYGVYEVGVTVLVRKTNVLNYTIWMTRLDTAHAVRLPSSLGSELTITNPLLPGLELHLPPGTVITDRHGKVVQEISITPVPLNKPPFPLPAGVQVPLYFTIQPGGAYLNVNQANGVKGARLIYPNAGNLAPGANFEFWNYDADAKGWFIYGLGKVSSDGKSVIPDPGVVIYEFTGAMVGQPGVAPGTGAPVGSSPKAKVADPVDLSTGQFIYTKTDLALPDTLPISLTRTYITNDSRSRAFGIGATFNYDIFMVGSISPYDYQELILPDGGRVRFDRITPGTDWSDAIYVHASSGSPFYGALLSPNSDPAVPGFWKLVMRDGTTFGFPESSASTTHFCQAVIGIQDRYGNRIKLDRDGLCRLTRITSPNGRFIAFTLDGTGRFTQATDSIGRTVLYTYDAAGRLSTVTDANSGITTYTYDDQNRMLTIKDPRKIVYLTNEYDGAGRVLRQTQADSGLYQFAWTAANVAQTHSFVEIGPQGGSGGSVLTRNGCWGNSGFNRYDPNCGEGYMALVSQVDVTDPRGYVRRVQFSANGYITSDTQALGQPEQQTITSTFYADNTLQSITDSLGRKTTYDYDFNGNTTRATRLDGTPDAVTSTFTYEPQFNQLASVTDPLNHTSSFSYDSHGSLATATDPLNHPISMAYNSVGQVSSVTDALNNTVQFNYLGGDLVSVTDPLGNVSSSFYDAAGRAIRHRDAQGNTTTFQYNPLNLLTEVTDSRQGITIFSYDPNGNLLTLTDALHLQNSTNWSSDLMDRVSTRTDPILRQESYVYDKLGNVVSSTDRKGQVTTLNYDSLNRVKSIGYNTVVNAGVTSYESMISYTYDAGNRMTQASDSAGGTITKAYDNLDRLTAETTPQGSISYGYDVAGRRTSMIVSGQPAASYTYDNANRLTQIAQGASVVGFGYDDTNRRTFLTMSNGVNVSYSYDNNSRVTGITYNFGGSTVGSLIYSYDELGRRKQVAGSLARTGLPPAISLANYDASNELTNWNGLTLIYDGNGNMLSDGSSTFTWNSRNQVGSVNNVSLQYDAFGRRTLDAAGNSFLYDRANTVQELSGTAVRADLLSDRIDEIFARTDVSGSFTPLRDALGSTIALLDANGTVQTTYTYEPFGNTSVSGSANANAFQYAGRQKDSDGLYYYRARYYSPVLGRFISEDPIKYRGGLNLYAYVLDDPISFVDPLGTQPCNKSKLIEAQNNAQNNPDWQQDQATGQTYCNFATQSIIEAMDAPPLPGRANDMAQALANGGDYQPVSPEQAQAIANEGGLVIAAWQNPNPKGPGHVATVRPLGVPGDTPLANGRGPLLNNIGSAQYSGTNNQNWVFGKTKTPLYYTLAGRKDCD